VLVGRDARFVASVANWHFARARNLARSWSGQPASDTAIARLVTLVQWPSAAFAAQCPYHALYWAAMTHFLWTIAVVALIVPLAMSASAQNDKWELWAARMTLLATDAKSRAARSSQFGARRWWMPPSCAWPAFS